MAERKTRKVGLAKPRLLQNPDPELRRTLDGIIERLEVLDGLRGDALDRAVTYRDLKDTSGFGIGGFSGSGVPIIGDTPGPPPGTTRRRG